MLQPKPGFNLGLLEHLFRIYYTLLKHHRIPLIPDTPYYCCPNPFPNHILFVTNLEQMEALKGSSYVLMLDKQDANPPVTH